jgi:hypothetical protein
MAATAILQVAASGPGLAAFSRGEVEFNVMNGNEGGHAVVRRLRHRDRHRQHLTNYFRGRPARANEWVFMDWWKKFPKK